MPEKQATLMFILPSVRDCYNFNRLSASHSAPGAIDVECPTGQSCPTELRLSQDFVLIKYSLSTHLVLI